ncbi:MAG: hypothetical protein ACRESV_11305 [Nevskiales bacterium]
MVEGGRACTHLPKLLRRETMLSGLRHPKPPTMSAGTTTPTGAPPKKTVATVALVDLEEPAAGILRDCFKQFGIQTAALEGDVAQLLRRQ